MTTERGTSLPGTGGQPPVPALQRFLQPRPPVAPGERCEMCTEPIADDHSHVVDLSSRNLICTCRGCYLLFTTEGAAGGKYRAIPDRYRYLPRFAITGAQWDELQIPVGMAFFFRNSEMGRFVAFYPSPGGATESLLPLETWHEVLEANPAVAGLADDVEALLLRRDGAGDPGASGEQAASGEHGASGEQAASGDHAASGGQDASGEGGGQQPGGAPGKSTATECYLVPIDACYELVGLVKLHWRGFQGGQEVWQEIGAFFGRLRERSEVTGGG